MTSEAKFFVYNIRRQHASADRQRIYSQCQLLPYYSTISIFLKEFKIIYLFVYTILIYTTHKI